MHGVTARSEPEETVPGEPGGMIADAIGRTRRLLARIELGDDGGRLTGELIELETQLSALTVAYEAHAARMFCATELVELGRRLEREAQADRAAAVPRPRRARRAGQPPLMVLAPG